MNDQNTPLPVATQDERKRLTHQDAAIRLEILRIQGAAFTGLAELAKMVGCSISTIHKAIQSKQTLRAWAHESRVSLGMQKRADVARKDTSPNAERQAVDDVAVRQFIEKADTPTKAWFLGLSPESQLDYLNNPGLYQILFGCKR